jgi:hypothetical protein
VIKRARVIREDGGGIVLGCWKEAKQQDRGLAWSVAWDLPRRRDDNKTKTQLKRAVGLLTKSSQPDKIYGIVLTAVLDIIPYALDTFSLSFRPYLSLWRSILPPLLKLPLSHRGAEDPQRWNEHYQIELDSKLWLGLLGSTCAMIIWNNEPSFSLHCPYVGRETRPDFSKITICVRI